MSGGEEGEGGYLDPEDNPGRPTKSSEHLPGAPRIDTERYRTASSHLLLQRKRLVIRGKGARGDVRSGTRAFIDGGSRGIAEILSRYGNGA